MHRVGILVQEPTVDSLEEVVKVVLCMAPAPAHARSVGDVHALLPPVIFAKSAEEVTAVGIETISEILGACPDIVPDIFAVSAGSSTTLVASQLHETLFASTTDSVGVAAAFLESDRSQEDSGKSELVTELLERPDIWPTSSKWAALSDGVVEVHGNEISYTDIGRIPSTAVDTTVHPINGSIRTGGLGDLFGSTAGSALAILSFDDTVGVGSRVVLGRIVVWLILLRLVLSRLIILLGHIVLIVVGTGVVFAGADIIDMRRTMLASTGVDICTAGDAVVVGTMDVTVVERCGFGEDRESGEENEGGEELHDDAGAERSVGRMWW